VKLMAEKKEETKKAAPKKAAKKTTAKKKATTKKAAPKKAEAKKEVKKAAPKKEVEKVEVIKEEVAATAEFEPKKATAKKEAPKKATEKKPRKAAKKKKKSVRTEHARGKRKKSIARATVREGSGRIRVNSQLISAAGNKYFRNIVEEPLLLIGPDGLKVDVSVKVRGGGEMGQAQACRTAIAKALVAYFGEGVLAKFKEDDLSLIKEDSRRVEPKKYQGPKARARKQKSYR